MSSGLKNRLGLFDGMALIESGIRRLPDFFVAARFPAFCCRGLFFAGGFCRFQVAAHSVERGIYPPLRLQPLIAACFQPFVKFRLKFFDVFDGNGGFGCCIAGIQQALKLRIVQQFLLFQSLRGDGFQLIPVAFGNSPVCGIIQGVLTDGFRFLFGFVGMSEADRFPQFKTVYIDVDISGFA